MLADSPGVVRRARAAFVVGNVAASSGSVGRLEILGSTAACRRVRLRVGTVFCRTTAQFGQSRPSGPREADSALRKMRLALSRLLAGKTPNETGFVAELPRRAPREFCRNPDVYTVVLQTGAVPANWHGNAFVMLANKNPPRAVQHFRFCLRTVSVQIVRALVAASHEHISDAATRDDLILSTIIAKSKQFRADRARLTQKQNHNKRNRSLCGATTAALRNFDVICESLG